MLHVCKPSWLGPPSGESTTDFHSRYENKSFPVTNWSWRLSTCAQAERSRWAHDELTLSPSDLPHSSHGCHENPTNASCRAFNLDTVICHLGPKTDVATYASLLRRCTVSEGERVHDHLIKRGYVHNVFLNNLLVQMYGKHGSLQHARAVFDNMGHRNLYSWTIMLAACAQNGHGKEALQLFGQMQVEGFEADKITCICVLDACASMEALKEGLEINACIVSNGWESDVVVGTALVNMYGKCGCVDDARAIFAHMPQRDVVSWSAMIAACAQNGHCKEALQLFGQMQAEGFEPNGITSISALDACASMAALEEGQEIHAVAVSNSWETDVIVGNALLNLYGKCGSLNNVRAVFAEMPHRNVVSWSSMISSLAQNGHGKEALQLFGEMQAEGFEPDKITLICILDACANAVALEGGRETHCNLIGNGWESDLVVETSLVNMYGKCGSLYDARAVFSEMQLRNVISWSAIIAGCAQNGHCKEALQLFSQMQAEGLKPDKVTFMCVLTACSHMGLVADGRQYFMSMSQDYGISPSAKHYACMIDLLGRAGQLEKAEQLIRSMPLEPVSSAWLSLISSCRIHGDVERALRTANYVLNVDEMNATPYVLLANIHGAATRWDVEQMTNAELQKCLKKVSAGSIEVKV